MKAQVLHQYDPALTALSWVTMQDAALVVPVLIGIGVILAALSAGFAIRRWLRT